MRRITYAKQGQVRFPFWLSRKQPRKARRMSDQQLKINQHTEKQERCPLGSPAHSCREVAAGLLVGIGLLFLVSRF